jgi:EAL domain-containing protein (putative c-di-GMP-specific phosphodiesterase class I)
MHPAPLSAPPRPAPSDIGLSKGGLPDLGLPDLGLPKGGLPKGGLPKGGLPKGGLPKGGLPDTIAEDKQPSAWRRLRQDLRQTVRDGRFSLAFQARRALADHTQLGADALLRWPSRGRGVVQSHTFMPLVEECGLTAEVAAWTLSHACQTAASWPGGIVSVAVPPSLARDGVLLPMLAEALRDSGLAPGRLEVALADNAVSSECGDTLLALSAMRDLGLGVALDGYGRAGACLIKLKRLPLTTIKLDRSLVRDMLCDRAAASMVRAAIDFAHTLDIDVVASGVETEAQRAFLRHVGCDAALERSLTVVTPAYDALEDLQLA